MSPKPMRIIVGADAFGLKLKDAVKESLQADGHQVEDAGVCTSDGQTPYFETARAVAQKVAAGDADRGILFCGTGMGMAIMANKTEGVYAAVCENTYAARMSRAVNNANVLTMGEFITGAELAKEIARVWLATEFREGFQEPVSGLLTEYYAGLQKLESRCFGA